MKTKSIRSLSAALVIITSSAAAQFSIPWYAVHGGGLNSTGGVYSVSGTIGQAAAGGPMTNGAYSVLGGFWALPVAVQTEGAPTLSIVPGSPGQAIISWTPASSGFVLQETPTLSPPNWQNAPSGSTNPVVVTAGPGERFYRLLKQ